MGHVPRKLQILQIACAAEAVDNILQQSGNLQVHDDDEDEDDDVNIEKSICHKW